MAGSRQFASSGADPSPCLRCTSVEPLQLDEPTVELYLYTALVTRRRSSLDIYTAHGGHVNGRLCQGCTEVVLDMLGIER